MFVCGDRTREFREVFYPNVPDEDWGNWRWQLRNRIRDLEAARSVFRLTPDEEAAIERRKGLLPLGVTPYYASLLDRGDPAQGLRRTKIPSMAEFDVRGDECADPLGEDAHSPVPGLVHTYPDKVLFLA